MNNQIHLTVNRRYLFLTIVGLSVLFLVWSVHKSNAKTPPESCTQAKAEGLINIPKSSPYYKPSLDRDKDGYACE